MATDVGSRAVPTARLNGIDVHYERGGDGPRLLFCNGSGATLESSAPVIARFREHFDVVAHDQRGLGRTTIPDGPYSMADYAADAAALLDHVGWDRCAVVGVSFGGMVAQELAVTWPERVERLALVCTSPGGPGRASYPLHELAELPAAEAAAIGLTLLDTRFTRRLAGDAPAGPGARRGARRPRRRTEAGRGAARRARAAAGPARPRRVGPPAAGVVPDARRRRSLRRDRPAARTARRSPSRIPGAELRLYEGGHLFFLQDRAAFPDILDFLAAG